MRLGWIIASLAVAAGGGFVAGAGRLRLGGPPSVTLFRCDVTGVHDGDGPIYCAQRGPDGKPIKIRLQAVAARELDETCSPGHPCPAASGAAAKAALTRLATGHRLRCEATGRSYARVTAWCWREDGVELNCAMVESGTALAWAKFDRAGRLCRQRAPA